MTPVVAASAALRRIHVEWAWVVIASNALVGLWALAAHRWKAARHPALWWGTAAAELTIFVQVVLGVVLIQGRDTKRYQFHMFYGFVAAFTVAILYSYRTQLKPWWYLLYGFGGLFLMGLGLRALAVGPH